MMTVVIKFFSLYFNFGSGQQEIIVPYYEAQLQTFGL